MPVSIKEKSANLSAFGLEEPKLYGDILVLPIDGFATNVPHSGPGKYPDQALSRHGFYRDSGEKEHEN